MEWSNFAGCLNGPDKTVASLRCLPALFVNIVNSLFLFAGSIGLIIIIVSGIRMIIAAGDAKQMETARKAIAYTIVGLLIIFFSYFILTVIAHVTGVTCILTFGPFSSSSCK